MYSTRGNKKQVDKKFPVSFAIKQRPHNSEADMELPFQNNHGKPMEPYDNSTYKYRVSLRRGKTMYMSRGVVRKCVCSRRRYRLQCDITKEFKAGLLCMLMSYSLVCIKLHVRLSVVAFLLLWCRKTILL